MGHPAQQHVGWGKITTLWSVRSETNNHHIALSESLTPLFRAEKLVWDLSVREFFFIKKIVVFKNRGLAQEEGACDDNCVSVGSFPPHVSYDVPRHDNRADGTSHRRRVSFSPRSASRHPSYPPIPPARSSLRERLCGGLLAATHASYLPPHVSCNIPRPAPPLLPHRPPPPPPLASPACVAPLPALC